MAMTDSYDLTLSTGSDEAASHYRRGVEHMLAAWTGAAEEGYREVMEINLRMAQG